MLTVRSQSAALAKGMVSRTAGNLVEREVREMRQQFGIPAF